MRRDDLVAITPREASIFACLADTLIAPEPALPPVAQTTTVAAFDAWLAAAPRLNRTGLRACMYLVEISPRLLGFRHRLRRLSDAERLRWAEKARGDAPAPVRQLADTMRLMAVFCYYGDDDVARQLGYDSDERIARGRALRKAERRP